LSGGELAAAVVLDCVARLLPGVLGDEQSTINESFAAADDAALPGFRGILDYPHYTRPAVYRDWGVPEVLRSGNHEDIRRWRLKQALAKTRRHRPDLLSARLQHGQVPADWHDILAELERENAENK
jgi:tRNA (guanine37-N1)-methyltransferase